MNRKTSKFSSSNSFLTENSVAKDALLPKEDFLRKFRISDREFDSTGIRWGELVKIYDDYRRNRQLFENIANGIIAKFLTSEAKEAGVHSVRYRLKSGESLIEKIIRKSIANMKNGISKKFTQRNYTNLITDLIGIRVLHVFKDDWFAIHSYILRDCQYQTKETPKVYYRKGDEKQYIDECKKHGCITEVHPKAYRSIHYIINPHPTKKLGFAEIQVRTVFEDGWSEIDHKLRYFSKRGAKHALDRYLLALNRIAGSADEIGSIIKSRQIELRKEESQRENNKKKKLI